MEAGGGVLLFSEVALRQINDTLRSIIHLVLSPQRNFPSSRRRKAGIYIKIHETLSPHAHFSRASFAQKLSAPLAQQLH